MAVSTARINDARAGSTTVEAAASEPHTLEARAKIAESRVGDQDAEIATLRLTIAKMRHERFGSSSEHSAKLDQLELQLAELVEKAAEAKTAEVIAAPAPAVEPEALKPARRPLPDALPRERRVHEGPAACPCCQATSFRKLGEDTTETLERVPAQWMVIVHVRERLACRHCDTILQAPAPTHPIARGRAGPQLLADVLYGKYGTHLPLNRQSVIYANEGVDLDVSTLADWVGASAATLKPLRDAIEAHVLRADDCDGSAMRRIHADDSVLQQHTERMIMRI